MRVFSIYQSGVDIWELTFWNLTAVKPGTTDSINKGIWHAASIWKSINFAQLSAYQLCTTASPSLPWLIAIPGRGGYKSSHLAMPRGSRAQLATQETIKALLQINKIKRESSSTGTTDCARQEE